MKFDKDDPQALDFVTAACNLRSAIFHIELTSRWSCKEIAGNIIPAIATTNAIIAGFIVLEALKVLSGRSEQCKYNVCNRLLTGRRRDVLLAGTPLDPPSEGCYVCGTSTISLPLDTTAFTAGMLIDQVIKKHLSFNRPTIDAETIAGDSDQIAEGADPDDLDETEVAKYARYRDLPLASLPQPIVTGSTLAVDDMTQDLSVKITVRHEILDPEEVPAGFLCSGAASSSTVVSNPTAATGDKRSLGEEEGDNPSKKARADVVEDEDDCIMLD